MKKFFTLCLVFMLASLLNVNAADTYTLVGENINGVSWDPAATQNDLVYEASTDSYVITGVTMSGKFKVAKNHAWTTAWGNNGKSIPTGAAYIAWTTGGDIAMPDNQTYTNCTVRFKLLDGKAASILITSDTAMSGTIDTRADVWCVAGSFSNDNWGDANEMTALGNGVYEFWSTELPSEFKFKAKGNWDICFGIHKEIKNTPIMGFDNALDKDTSNPNICLKADQVYDKYRYTLTVRGETASFRVDGYKEAVPSLTRVFYESFDQNEGTGGNDGAWKDSVANGAWDSAVFDEPGWTAANGYFANKCIKLGASSKLGSATTPALGVTGNAELRFKAGAWNGDATTINITINNGGTLSASSVTIANNAFTDYTISISDATPESTITFSATKAKQNRFFLDEVEVYANSSELPAAGITLTGVMKDANTAYYHSTLQTPTVTVTLPAGATYMDIEVDNNGWIDEYLSAKGKTEDYTIEFYSTGNFTINVTAYGEGVYSVASKEFVIEQVNSAWTFDELINKGEGATCYLNFSPTVVAHVGKYLYLDGYDSLDGIRSSALVYASLDKTYKKGDVLQGFIATVSYYNGNPQLTPLTTSLGEPYSYSDPYVYEVEAGDAWKAFAVEANVNKYVRVKNAPVTANPDAVDGVTAYTKHLGVNMPEDVTKKYDVEGFINNFNGTIQIKPISFTAIEEKIEPFTYTEIVPANNAEVTSLSDIKITFPYDVTYDAEVSVLVMDGENMITPTVAVQGNVATLTFDAITAYGSKPSLMVMAGAFKEANSGVGCQQIMAVWSIPTPPVRADYIPTSISPADGKVVESIKNIYFFFDDENPCATDKAYDAPYKGYVTVKDGNGNNVATDVYLDVKEVSGQWVGFLQPLYGSSYTTPGTYVITLAEGLFSDQQYYDTNGKKGRINPEFTITYTIKGAALAAPTVDPANGAEVENPSTVTLTFAEAVTVNAEAGAITLVNNSNQNLDYAKNIAVAISEDGLTATITSEPSLGAWTAETYTMSIPAGYFVATSGAANEALSYNWKVVAPKFTYVAVDPAQGEVESLETIFIDFGGFRPRPIDGSMYPTYNLVNANGETVTTAATNYSYEQIDGSYYYKLKVTLGAKVTTPGDYFLTIPAGVFKDKDVYSGYNENAEMTFKWTVGAAVEPLAAPTADPANGAEVENPSTVTLTFAEAVTVNAEAGELSMVNTADAAYDFAKNFNVAISEDGLTATITCEPGYPSSAPRWAIGKTYKLNIPAGYFVGASGAANEALEYSWKVVPAPFTVASTTPEVGEVEKLDVIKVYFTENKVYTNIGYSWASLELVDNAGQVVTTGSVVKDGNYVGDVFKSYLVVTLAQPVTTPGQYTLVIPEGYARNVEWGEGAINVATNLTWTVIEPDPNTYNFEYNVSPAEGVVTELNKIVFTAKVAGQMLMPTAEAQVANWVKVVDANGNVYNTTAIAGTGYDVTIEGITEPGDYTVTVPKGSFYDLMGSMTNPGSLNYNDEIVLHYEVVAASNVIYDYAPVSISPANGSEVETLEYIHIYFPYGVYDCLWGAMSYSQDFIKVSDDKGNTYDAKIGYGYYTEDYYIYVKDATAPGTYTIVVPEALVFDEEYSDTFESGHANPEFTLTYTIKAPVVEDFTPVISPAAGNITVDQMNETVITFESPIASFDPGYVKYIKSFGNVWLETMGEYTISEDKLTLTLNWNLVKGNYPPGTSYTLELPAGCIVLENGAKNLLTQVNYTIVAGPKDLAEFVVPAGINGYINYDETDVNAWAPEFPFTVSTTANNTIAFAAELPSLPAGITAMEVIDENGEVIATLNQDGVAPLADGEIYYVKGETTKEYVDGAELKFRFRFTHLGVSETIQFSYIVAGGNITSIADVELDGNVIVRGNDIIAPQGAAIFTVSGIRVPAEGLAPGVYVVVLGNQAVKVMVK